MKFIHISDLHLGKSIHGVSLIDNQDQVVWVDRFLEKVKEIRPDAVVIAGDIYDRSAPSGDAMRLFDHLLTSLAEMEIPVCAVAGNHDSGQRLSFGGQLFARSQIYISGILEKELMHVAIPEKDGTDEVIFWMLPYVFPALVAQKLEEDSIHDYDTAVRKLLEIQQIDPTKRNVLIAHQNVTLNGQEAQCGGSESMVGGVGQIEYTAFDQFDYVALGHIHAAYPVGRPEVRYAGSPLCYHFDEIHQQKKGPLLVTIGPKSETPESSAVVQTETVVQSETTVSNSACIITTELLEIPPLHPMRELKGPYNLIRQAEENSITKGEYLRIILTDTRITPEISDYFRQLFSARDSIVMELLSEYKDDLNYAFSGHSVKDVAAMSLEDLFSEFYSNRKKGSTVSDTQREILSFARTLTMEKGADMDTSGTATDEDTQKLLNYVLETVKEL